jgi:ferric-dicitrate binding protein FerR (iron transport regulator)
MEHYRKFLQQEMQKPIQTHNIFMEHERKQERRETIKALLAAIAIAPVLYALLWITMAMF